MFVTEQGLKLLDFGLARQPQRTESLTVSALTVPGAVKGTLRYMAPEQITGDPVDVRTDVFALGVMLYEMLTGRLPFDVPTNLDWLQAVLKEDAPAMGNSRAARSRPGRWSGAQAAPGGSLRIDRRHGGRFGRGIVGGS